MFIVCVDKYIRSKSHTPWEATAILLSTQWQIYSQFSMNKLIATAVRLKEKGNQVKQIQTEAGRSRFLHKDAWPRESLLKPLTTHQTD